MKHRQWWHVVVSTGIVQGVFGAALWHEASELAKELTKQFPFAAATVETGHGFRPRVGQTFPAGLHRLGEYVPPKEKEAS